MNWFARTLRKVHFVVCIRDRKPFQTSNFVVEGLTDRRENRPPNSLSWSLTFRVNYAHASSMSGYASVLQADAIARADKYASKQVDALHPHLARAK